MKNIPIIILLLFSMCLFAQNQIDSLEALLPSKEGLERVDILNELAFKYKYQSPDKGLDYANMAYTIALKENSKKDIARSLQSIGLNYLSMGEFQLTLENYQKSLKIYEELNDSSGICTSFNNISIVYNALSDYDMALKYSLKSLRISEKNPFSSLYIKTIGNIGNIYIKLNNYPEALKYIQEAIDLSDKSGVTSVLAHHLIALGEIYSYQKDYKKEKSAYKKALQLFKKEKNNLGITICLYNLGGTELSLKNYDSAMEYYQEALILSEQINDPVGVLLVNISFGFIYKEQNQFDSALCYYNKAFELAVELDSKEDKLKLYKNYSELYKAVGQFEKSLDYLEKFTSLKDSIFNESSSKQIADMQTKYNSEKKEKENELLRKNSEIQNLEIEKQTNLRNSFIGVSILVILMIIIILNRFSIKKKANQLLILKNKVISDQRDELKKSNSTKDKFFSIISHDLRSPFNSILGFTNLLVDDYNEIDDTEKRELIHLLNKSSQLAFELLENLLTWARTQSGGIEINKELLNLKELVESSIAPYALNAAGKDIKIVINVPSRSMLSIDKNTSIAFISNLVNNAIKFTPEGGTITIRYHENRDNIELHIIDTGVGMTSEVIGKLFKIEESVSTRGTNNEKGTGLGLILCKEFINKNGGDISVISEVGKGSEFIITLPK